MGREYIFHGVQVRATTLYPIVMEQQSGLPHVRNLVASDNPDVMIIMEDFLLYIQQKIITMNELHRVKRMICVGGMPKPK